VRLRLTILIAVEFLLFGFFALVVHGILWAGPHPSWGSRLYFVYSSIGCGISLGFMDYRILCGCAWDLDQTFFMFSSSLKLLPVYGLVGTIAAYAVKLAGVVGRSRLKRTGFGV